MMAYSGIEKRDESYPARWSTLGNRSWGGGHRLRFLSYNIQTGIASHRYRHYVTHSWKHVFPDARRWTNLWRIAQGLASFDIVGLQEADPGSLRTGFINQTQYLAEQAKFPFWYHQTNRRLGKLAQYSNGLLSRLRPQEIVDYKLPGLPGRGALMVRFGSRQAPLVLFIIHLALGKRGRLRQMGFLSELANEYANVIVMGDLNCDTHSKEMKVLLGRSQLRMPPAEFHTFPSWQPRWKIDHILVTPGLRVERSYIPPWTYSDHLPIAMDVLIPDSVRLQA